MSFALGVVLSTEAVQAASTTSGQVLDDAVLVVPPVLFIDGPNTLHGGAAVAAGEARPQSLVSDVVGQFHTDRLFLNGGRMLTADDAMKELLLGVMNEVTTRRGESPGAVTVSHPAAWDAATRQRVARIVAALRWHETEVRVGLDAAAASGDAWTRLPRQEVITRTESGEMPDTRSGFRRESDVQESEPVEFHRTEVSSTRRAVMVSAAALVALVGGIGLAVVLTQGDEPSSASSTTASTTTVALVLPGETTTVVSATPAVIGVVAGPGTEAEVRSIAAEISTAGGVLGRPLEVQTAAVGANLSEAIDALGQQGATFIVTDLPADALGPVLEGARFGDLPTCSVTGAPNTSVGRTAVAGGSVRECTESLALAAEAAGDVDPIATAAAWRELLGDDGVICDSYTYCVNLIRGNQRIEFQPANRSISLAN